MPKTVGANNETVSSRKENNWVEENEPPVPASPTNGEWLLHQIIGQTLKNVWH